MMTRKLIPRVALSLLLALTLTGCVEFLDLLEITAYEESDDPRVEKTGRVLRP